MHALLSNCTVLTKPTFKGKITKNFETTAAQVTCPWSILVLVKRLDVPEQLSRRIKEEKKCSDGFPK